MTTAGGDPRVAGDQQRCSSCTPLYVALLLVAVAWFLITDDRRHPGGGELEPE